MNSPNIRKRSVRCVNRASIANSSVMRQPELCIECDEASA